MSKQDEEYVYFELNNWWPGSCYPNVDPFKTWCGNDLCLSFEDEDFYDDLTRNLQPCAHRQRTSSVR